jgi:hypothetical protein
VDRRAVIQLVDRELAAISDPAVLDLFRMLRVDPSPVEREWDYGTPGQLHVCWTVMEHKPSNTGVAYCNAGFGSTFHWGLVFLSGPHLYMDSAWYTSLEAAVRESRAWQGENPPGYEITLPTL